MTPLDTLASSIRRAVASGAYDEAERLLAGYCPSSRDEIPAATELFDWVFRMVSAGKAHDAAQLAALRRVVQYRHPKPEPAPSWQLEG